MTSACLLGTAVKRWAWSSVWGSLQKGSIFISNTESRVSEPRAELDKSVGRAILALKDGATLPWADAICRFSDLWQDRQEVHAYFSRFQRR